MAQAECSVQGVSQSSARMIVLPLLLHDVLKGTLLSSEEGHFLVTSFGLSLGL